MSNICEEKMELPAEHERNVFGQFDEHVKKLERALGVTVISRDGQIKILGPRPSCDQAVKILKRNFWNYPERKHYYPAKCQLCTFSCHGGENLCYYRD